MKYLSLTAQLKAREKRLPDSVDIDRMIGATSVEESFKVLNDTDYAPFISSRSHQQIEEVIKAERESFRKELRMMGVEEEAVKVLFLPDDLTEVAKTVKEKGEGKIADQITAMKPKTPQEVDDLIVDFYLEMVVNFFKEEKDKELLRFFEEYREVISGEELSREEALQRMEEDVIKKSAFETDGFLPLLSFFIKKRRMEKAVRVILSAKRMGLTKEEITDLIKETRVL